MTALPDIPRLYTALAECLAVLLVTPALMPRFSKAVTVGVTLLRAGCCCSFRYFAGMALRTISASSSVVSIGFCVRARQINSEIRRPKRSSP